MHFLRRSKVLFGSVFSVLLSLPAHAASVQVDFTATIGFNPGETVGVGGENVATLIDQLFGAGIGSTGSATLMGRFVYDSTVPSTNENAFSAGYLNAITSAQISFGTNTAVANLAGIAANAASSDIGYNTNPIPGFCNGLEACNEIGADFTGTGNRIGIADDVPFFIIRDGNRVDFPSGDFIVLGVGGTDLDADFGPAIGAGPLGDVSVDAVEFGVISTITDALNNGVALPDSADFLNSSEVDQSLFLIEFEGSELTQPLALNGSVDRFDVSDPDVIPLPLSGALLLSGLMGLGLIRKRQG